MSFAETISLADHAPLPPAGKPQRIPALAWAAAALLNAAALAALAGLPQREPSVQQPISVEVMVERALPQPFDAPAVASAVSPAALLPAPDRAPVLGSAEPAGLDPRDNPAAETPAAPPPTPLVAVRAEADFTGAPAAEPALAAIAPPPAAVSASDGPVPLSARPVVDAPAPAGAPAPAPAPAVMPAGILRPSGAPGDARTPESVPELRPVDRGPLPAAFVPAAIEVQALPAAATPTIVGEGLAVQAPGPALVAQAPPALPAQNGPMQPLREADPRPLLREAALSVSCGRVEAELDPDGETVRLSGHLISERERRRFVERVSGIVGGRRVVERDLYVVGEPYCRVLGFLAAPALVRSTDQRFGAEAIGAPAQAGVLNLRGGMPLELRLVTPDFESHVRVDYFTSDGRVYHLLPVGPADEGPMPPKLATTIGGHAGRGLKATVGPPFGLDLVVALASTGRLPLTPRPVAEDAREYLAALRESVAALGAREPGARIEFSYYLVTTAP